MFSDEDGNNAEGSAKGMGFQNAAGKTVQFSLDEIKAYATKELDELWNEYKRVLNPQDYPVDLAKDVWDNKMTLIDNVRKKAHDLSE